MSGVPVDLVGQRYARLCSGLQVPIAKQDPVYLWSFQSGESKVGRFCAKSKGQARRESPNYTLQRSCPKAAPCGYGFRSLHPRGLPEREEPNQS